MKDLSIKVTDLIAFRIIIPNMSIAFITCRPALGRSRDPLFTFLAHSVASTIISVVLFNIMVALKVPTTVSRGIRIFSLANLNFMLRPFHEIVVITVTQINIFKGQLVCNEPLLSINYIL